MGERNGGMEGGRGREKRMEEGVGNRGMEQRGMGEWRSRREEGYGDMGTGKEEWRERKRGREGWGDRREWNDQMGREEKRKGDRRIEERKG